MIVPGLIAIIAGLFLCWRLRDTPSAMGLPTVGEWRKDAMELAQQTQDAGLSHRQILRKYVLGNPISGCSPAVTYWSMWCAPPSMTGATST